MSPLCNRRDRVVPTERVLLVGEPETCDRARSKIEVSETIHAVVVAQVDLEAASDGTDDAIAALAQVSQDLDVHRVVIAPPSTDHGEVLNLIRAAKAVGMKVSVLPRMLEVIGSSVEFDDLEGLNVLGVRRFGLTRSSQLVKRTVDIVASGIALLLVLPLLGFVALAIKLDSRGPVFFRQRRVGRCGEIFMLLKFRTMVADAEERKADLESSTRPTACSRSPTTRASRASAASCARPRSMSCRSSSTC